MAETLRAGLKRLEPAADIFFSPLSLGPGFWVRKLPEEIAAADAFLLLIGPSGVGDWQQLEYDEALDRHVHEQQRFPLVPVIAAGAKVPGLSFLRRLNWVEVSVPAEDKALHRLLAALRGETVVTATPLWKLVNPYRGLEAMIEANTDYFFGRSGETAAALMALAEKRGRCPILIGASGVGKSSVARAGVLSALKSMQWPGSERSTAGAWPAGLEKSRGWLSLVVRPGEAPLQALAVAFIQLWRLDEREPDQAALPRKWAEGLSSGRNKLVDLIGATQGELNKRAGEAPERVLIYLDQGEELYTRATPQEARRFSEVMAEGLSDHRLFAFASLRADYFGRLQADEPLFNCYEHVDVPPLDRGQLLEVVTAPARALGVSFEDGKIADRITDAAAAQPGALPLLSYLMADMWKDMVARDQPVLRLQTQIIDVGGVLTSRAEEFLTANPQEEPALRRLLTLKLATVPPAGEPLRRPTRREECTEQEWSLAERLAEQSWRLVVIAERSVDRTIVAEVAHEALLRAWPRLMGWLRDQREFLIFKGDVERSELRWCDLGRADEALLTGLDLRQAERFLPGYAADLSEEVVDFIRRSIDAARPNAFVIFKRDVENAERRWREMGQTDKALLTGHDLARAEQWLPTRASDLSAEVAAFVQQSIAADRSTKERQLRLQRWVTGGAVAAAVIMLLIGGFAWIQWGEASRERDRATVAEGKAGDELKKAQHNWVLGVKTIRDLVEGVGVGLANGTVTSSATRDLLRVAENALKDLQNVQRNSDTAKAEIVLWLGFYETLTTLGDNKEALKNAERVRNIAIELIASEPSNRDWPWFLYAAEIRIGNELDSLGDLRGGLEHFRVALALVDKARTNPPNDPKWEKQFPNIHNHVGDILMEQGELKEALHHFQISLAISKQRAVPGGPDFDDWLANKAAAALRIGDILLEQGDLPRAREVLYLALAAREELVAKQNDNAGYINNLAFTLTRIGSLLKQDSDTAGALVSYQRALALREGLIDRDPGNTMRLRLVTFVLNGLGDLLMAKEDWSGASKYYQRALGIRDSLARRDPDNVRMAINLAESLWLTADVAASQQSYEEALDRYVAATKIVERLAATQQVHPSDVQQKMFTAYTKLGEFYCKRKLGNQAAAYYRQAIQIADRFVTIDSTNSSWAKNVDRANKLLVNVASCQ